MYIAESGISLHGPIGTTISVIRIRMDALTYRRPRRNGFPLNQAGCRTAGRVRV